MPPLKPADLPLFVASEPGPGDEPGWNYVRTLRGVIPRSSGVTPPYQPQGPLFEERQWHFSREVVLAVNLVLEEAESVGKTVTLVDVERPGLQQDLVNRWVGPQDLLPLLVRPDGARLEGIDEFTPRKVRQFIRG
jgi:hypothetical protein